MDRVVVTVEHHGNTSAASVPLALDTAVRDGRIKPGRPCCWRPSVAVSPGARAAQILISFRIHPMTETNSQLAMVFPGQGSQAIGMLSELGAGHPTVLETFREASEVLGYDLWALCQQGPAEELNQTDRTQPAMLAAGVAVWRAWCEQGGARPA
jgi:acyl transferase domain-containing protein